MPVIGEKERPMRKMAVVLAVAAGLAMLGAALFGCGSQSDGRGAASGEVVFEETVSPNDVVLDHFGYWDFSYNLSCLNSRRKRRSSYGHQG